MTYRVSTFTRFYVVLISAWALFVVTMLATVSGFAVLMGSREGAEVPDGGWLTLLVVWIAPLFVIATSSAGCLLWYYNDKVQVVLDPHAPPVFRRRRDPEAFHLDSFSVGYFGWHRYIELRGVRGAETATVKLSALSRQSKELLAALRSVSKEMK